MKGSVDAAGGLSGLRVPVYGIFLILLLQMLVFASSFLIPVTAAILGVFVLNRPRRWLERIGVPAVLTAMLFTLAIAAAIAIILVLLSSPTATFIDNLPELAERIKSKLATSGGALEAISDAADAADDIIDEGAVDAVEVEVVTDGGFVATIFSLAPALLSRIAFALVLLFFLVASGDLFLNKAVQSTERFTDKRSAVQFAHTIEDRLGYYLGGITAINAALGTAIALAMMLWGMPSALVIGCMAFALNFVPFLGALLGATIAAAIAFVSFDGVWAAVGVFATYMALTSIEGQFVTPLLISRRMRLNTTIVFLSVAFFAWIWSVMGMVVALPILIVAKIVCDEVPALRTVGRFIGDIDDGSDEKSRRRTGD